jgi:hypothetical protein
MFRPSLYLVVLVLAGISLPAQETMTILTDSRCRDYERWLTSKDPKKGPPPLTDCLDAVERKLNELHRVGAARETGTLADALQPLLRTAPVATLQADASVPQRGEPSIATCSASTGSTMTSNTPRALQQSRIFVSGLSATLSTASWTR